jgi:hypothetical protein
VRITKAHRCCLIFNKLLKAQLKHSPSTLSWGCCPTPHTQPPTHHLLCLAWSRNTPAHPPAHLVTAACQRCPQVEEEQGGDGDEHCHHEAHNTHDPQHILLPLGLGGLQRSRVIDRMDWVLVSIVILLYFVPETGHTGAVTPQQHGQHLAQTLPPCSRNPGDSSLQSLAFVSSQVFLHPPSSVRAGGLGRRVPLSQSPPGWRCCQCRLQVQRRGQQGSDDATLW